MSGLEFLDDDLAQLDRQHLRRAKRIFPANHSDSRPLHDFASNDYLGLSQHPRVKAAAQDAIDAHGVGATASALVTGRSALLEALEQALADFEQQESAVVFPSGYAANVGTISALASDRDVVFCDRLNHASLIDGCKLSGARMRVYRHDRLDKLERELTKSAAYRRRFIVTDSVFSMDGDIAPLPSLCHLSERFDATMIVDEAHATGVIGENGRGVCEQLGVEHRVSVRIGTLSKAVGCLGGFVAGPVQLTDWLWNTARSQMFSTALPPAVCAATTAAIEIITAESDRRHQLHQQVRQFREGLAGIGIRVQSADSVPILPIIIGDPERTMTAARQLEHCGYVVGAIRHPTVPRQTERLRITISVSQGAEASGRLLEALASLDLSEK